MTLSPPRSAGAPPDSRPWGATLPSLQLSERDVLAPRRMPVALAPWISTDRLLLRPHSPRDAEAWFRIQSDPETVRYLAWPPRSREESRTHLAKRTTHTVLEHADDFLALAVERDGVLIGDVSMHLRVVAAAEREVEAGWLLDRHQAGRGYAFEAAGALLSFAFTEVRARRASAVIHEHNVRSLALAERLGFERWSRRDGRWRLVVTEPMLQRALANRRGHVRATRREDAQRNPNEISITHR
ncbi:GNAT family N-acetyltransferase [Microterricola viridarii]|uniref:Protein N-acetyltransferase, RimJ/RimL family n=1 Tax=Microterricola viridarii TaxID=412690 RepID=A0A1H1M652_9MICO|nr:GNAT family N-acetyltransferase [Microterricola viridarii]SDR82258.1 Protein N-acetyltransferase, RimJ/RimL family [Microterricola viridarii]